MSFEEKSNRVKLNINQTSLSLRHLQVELARIDALLRREVRRWQLANQDAADSFRGFYVSHEDAQALLNRSLHTSWGQTITLPPDEAEMYARAQAEASQQSQAFLKTAQRQNQVLRLVYLAAAFGLSRFEIDTFLICLAPTLDLRYEQVYGYLQDHVARKRPTINLILNLLAKPGPDRLIMMSYFSDEAALFKHKILKIVTEPGQADSPLLSHSLVVDSAIASWLWGDYQPHTDLGPNASLMLPKKDEFETLLPAEARENLESLAAHDNPAMVFYGADQGSQELAARFLSFKINRPLLKIDLKSVVNDQLPIIEALRLILRDARLTGAIPCMFGWDICLEDKKVPAHILTELCTYPGPVIVAGEEKWQPSSSNRDRSLFWQEFGIPDYSQRRALWQHYLKISGSNEINRDESVHLDTNQLADQFFLTTKQIEDAVMSAKDGIIQHNAPLEVKDLFASARDHSSTRLATLAKKITPRYDWEDIVLPEDPLRMLREIVNTVKERTKVLKEWGLGDKLASSNGVTVLFGGPPGTGKTMGAEVMAKQLGLDLYKIDLSTLISKYIGETEKNLERIFTEAESSNAILFFDEADSLFGKRSEVKDSHDRYANIEVSYLLQRMEAYNGVTILATNLRANLDEAFTRRLHFAISFPFPDKEDRKYIWRTLFPDTLPHEDNLDLDLMANRFKLAGGNIRNIIVGAAYLAASDGGKVSMAHLMHSTSRELQKMGRLVKERDLKF